MKLTTKGRYAVMAMADLAAHSTGRPVCLADIASRQRISLSYLEQLFAKLRRRGLVRSMRGPGGGYLLSRSADDTCVADIVLAVDEPLKATRCKPDAPQGCGPEGQRCLTHDLWEALGDQIQLYLSSVSLADVVNRRVPGARVMDSEVGAMPRAAAAPGPSGMAMPAAKPMRRVFGAD